MPTELTVPTIPILFAHLQQLARPKEPHEVSGALDALFREIKKISLLDPTFCPCIQDGLERAIGWAASKRVAGESQRKWDSVITGALECYAALMLKMAEMKRCLPDELVEAIAGESWLDRGIKFCRTSFSETDIHLRREAGRALLASLLRAFPREGSILSLLEGMFQGRRMLNVAFPLLDNLHQTNPRGFLQIQRTAIPVIISSDRWRTFNNEWRAGIGAAIRHISKSEVLELRDLLLQARGAVAARIKQDALGQEFDEGICMKLDQCIRQIDGRLGADRGRRQIPANLPIRAEIVINGSRKPKMVVGRLRDLSVPPDPGGCWTPGALVISDTIPNWLLADQDTWYRASLRLQIPTETESLVVEPVEVIAGKLLVDDPEPNCLRVKYDRAPTRAVNTLRRFFQACPALEQDAESAVTTGLNETLGSLSASRDELLKWTGGTSSLICAVIFTDILDSTVLCRELGDDIWIDILHKHFLRAQTLTRETNGFLIKNTGDGLLGLFHTAREATRFAISLYEATGHPVIRIRAGVNVGQINIKDDDAFGGEVNKASRITGFLSGDGLVLGDRAKEDVEQTGDPELLGLEWLPHPNVSLKGLKEPLTLWTVARRTMIDPP